MTQREMCCDKKNKKLSDIVIEVMDNMIKNITVHKFRCIKFVKETIVMKKRYDEERCLYRRALP